MSVCKDGYIVPDQFATTTDEGWTDYELYAAAEVAALQLWSPHQDIPPMFWAARYAARATACAMLKAAKEAGVTDEQWEKMRKVAARVATD